MKPQLLKQKQLVLLVVAASMAMTSVYAASVQAFDDDLWQANVGQTLLANAPAAPVDTTTPGLEPAAPANSTVAPAVASGVPMDSAGSNVAAAPDITVVLPADVVAAEVVSAAPIGIVKGSGDLFSIDFAEEDIRNVVRSIADLFDLNIVVPENLTGMVSVKLKDVTWQEVFGAILDPVGFSYIQDGKIIKIKAMQDINNEPVETRIFPMKFSDATVVINSIMPLIDVEAGGRILADKRTNVLIITERPTRLKQLEAVVTRLDSAESQIMIETRIAEIAHTDGSKSGLDWTDTLGGKLKLTVGNNPNTGGLTSNDMAGINRTFIPTDSTYARAGDTIIFNVAQFSSVLQALQNNTHAKVVASPNVVTMNNTTATINITQKQPIPNYTYNEQQGRFEISGFNYEDIGVILDVTPKAQADLITLDIKPEVSTQQGSVAFGSAGAPNVNIPVINSRRTRSVVTLQSGYTLAMGGLMKEDTTNQSNKVPVLGYLPGLGRLFSSESETTTTTNLVLFVTATRIGFNGDLLVPHHEGLPANANPRVMHAMEYTERDMPGYSMTDAEKKALEDIRALRSQQSAEQYEAMLQGQMQVMQQPSKK